jgi:xanthine dehydrogenase YagS FAD-binding subunit
MGMGVIRDVIPAFELFQPTTVDDVLGLLDRHGPDTWLMAGGMDSFDWLKDRIRRPRVVIDLSGVEALRGIKEADGGLEIGAMTTLTDITKSTVVRDKFGLLMVAADHVASPQIRNIGTLGGNIVQDTRCWYYRQGWPCYRAGGNICYADAPTAINREHAIFEADRCVAVNPSDTAPALVALDASMVVRSVGGRERVIAAQDFFLAPGYDIVRMTALEQGDLLTAIRIPGTFAGKQFYFEKIRDRQVWDFGLMSVASAISGGSSIEDSRIVVNGVAARPYRLTQVEAAIRGKARNEETAQMAAEMAVRGAAPLTHNGYKVPLMANLVKRAIRGAAEWTS